jgi:hypothetical protein
MPGNNTLLLDRTTNDLVLDAAGNIAVASEPYSLAQDAASAIKAYKGECFWDTTLGVPWLTQIFGKSPSIAQLKSLFIAAALTVPGVASAQCFIVAANNRNISGQIQVKSAATGQVSAANFSVINIQGPG